MTELQARVERLLTEAAECDVVAGLASEAKKRELFERLARDYRELAADVKKMVAIRGDISN